VLLERRNKEKAFIACVDNRGYESSLENRKIYEVLIDNSLTNYSRKRLLTSKT
jgi:hypothetical protein